MVFAKFLWLWSGKQSKDPKTPKGAAVNPSDSVFLESDTLKFPAAQRGKKGSSSSRARKKWQSEKERKVDREFDVVIVPSDGVCFSDSESDDSDWSIGWLEPHSPAFQKEDDSDNSFAVLVPCYGQARSQPLDKLKGNLMDNFGVIPDLNGEESKKHLEQWLSSLQKGSIKPLPKGQPKTEEKKNRIKNLKHEKIML